MATQTSNETVDVSTRDRTWRVTIESPKGEVPYISIHREQVKTFSDGSEVVTVNPVPIIVSALELGDLADHAVIPKELSKAIPDVGKLRSLLLMLPALVSLTCDAAATKSAKITESTDL